MTALSLMAVTAPLSCPLLVSFLSPSAAASSSSSLMFLLAFGLGCALAVVVSLSLRRKKGCRLKEEARRRVLAERAAEGSAVAIVEASSGGGVQRYHQGRPEWVPVPSPPPPPLSGGGEEREEKKKKKKRGRKKKQEAQSGAGSDGGEETGSREKDRVLEWAGGKQGMDCIYPFSTFSSATQRRIKQQYDQLVKSNQAKALTMAQVSISLPSLRFHFIC